MIRESMAMKFRPIQFTPMKITPMVGPRPLGERRMFSRQERRGPEILPDAGGQPPCTPEDFRRFKKDWHNIVPVIAMSHPRRHKEDVLHGGSSLNMLLPVQRETKDYDIYSPHPRPSATRLEAAIDRRTGCDVCETGYTKIPKSAILQRKSEGAPTLTDELYRIKTKQRSSFLRNDPDVDVMKKPAGLKTIRKHGITHESPEEAYAKAVYLRGQPTRMMKARQDIQRIEEHLGIEEQTRPSMVMRPRRMRI